MRGFLNHGMTQVAEELGWRGSSHCWVQAGGPAGQQVDRSPERAGRPLEPALLGSLLGSPSVLTLPLLLTCWLWALAPLGSPSSSTTLLFGPLWEMGHFTFTTPLAFHFQPCSPPSPTWDTQAEMTLFSDAEQSRSHS